jgi:hypothetical protein
MKKKPASKTIREGSPSKGLFDSVDFDEVFGKDQDIEDSLDTDDDEDNESNLPAVFETIKPSELVIYEPKDITRDTPLEAHIDEDLHLLNGSLKQIHAMWPTVRNLDTALKMIREQSRLIEQRRKAANKQWGTQNNGRGGPDIVMPPIE